MILPPVCPLCGDPENWRCGLVFHPRWIHYRESAACRDDPRHWLHLETIVVRTYKPASLSPEPPKRQVRQHQVEVLEIC